MTASPSCFVSKTLGWDDLRAPDVAPAYAALRGFALRLGAGGTRFAVNGILKRRLWVRRAKMWEYARGLACVLGEAKEGKEGKEVKERSQPGRLRVLDFGGGATLPIFHLAEQGAEVLCLDVDAALAGWTNEVAGKRDWKLEATTHDLTQTPAPAEWGAFDAVISFSVLEHISAESQTVALSRLGALLRPGGVMALTFDYGTEAAQPFAIRDEAGVARLVGATGLQFLDPRGFVDTGERFALDKRHKAHKFTFASLMMKK